MKRVFQCFGFPYYFLKRMEEIVTKLDELLDAVRKQKTVVDGMVVVMNDLRGRLIAQGLDEQKVDAALSEVNANTDEISSALVDNTTPPAPTDVPTNG